MAFSYTCSNYTKHTSSSIVGINTTNNIRYHNRDWFERIRRIMDKRTLSMFLALLCWAILPVVIMVECPFVKLVGISMQVLIIFLQIMLALSE